MPPTSSASSSVATLARQHGLVLGICVIAGALLGGVLAAALPPRFSAKGALRVASAFPPGLAIIDAPTVAAEASRNGSCQRAADALDVEGQCELVAVFKTDVVDVSTTAGSAADAERLLDGVSRLVVDEQNGVATRIFQPDNASIVVRPAVRLEPLAKARPAIPTPANLVAFGAALGLCVGVLVTSARGVLARA